MIRLTGTVREFDSGDESNLARIRARGRSTAGLTITWLLEGVEQQLPPGKIESQLPPVDVEALAL